jgi:hypothetical protein
MLSLEDLSDGQLDRLKAAFGRLANVPVAARDVAGEQSAIAGRRLDEEHPEHT